MSTEKKKLGEDRRDWILAQLKNSQLPVTGSQLAKHANVSRQVIVGDITLLKARNEPIIATSQGYLYLQQTEETNTFLDTIVCEHTPEQTEEELNIIVDHGVTVKDVKIEHPVYGDLTASIMVSNRIDVQRFLEKVKETNAHLLSNLTSGLHIHTIEALSQEAIEQAKDSLRKANILVDED